MPGYEVLAELAAAWASWPGPAPGPEPRRRPEMILTGCQTGPAHLPLRAGSRAVARLQHPTSYKSAAWASKTATSRWGSSTAARWRRGERHAAAGSCLGQVDTHLGFGHPTAHQHGIIHRTLAKANILFQNFDKDTDQTEDRQGGCGSPAWDSCSIMDEAIAKITDFGLASKWMQ